MNLRRMWLREGIETTENIEFFAENVETPKMQVPAEIQDNLVDAI